MGAQPIAQTGRFFLFNNLFGQDFSLKEGWILCQGMLSQSEGTVKRNGFSNSHYVIGFYYFSLDLVIIRQVGSMFKTGLIVWLFGKVRTK